MPDRIPTFQAKIGVNDAPGFNVSLPGVVDVGQEIGSLGTSLLQEAEPHVRERAIKFAESEAAQLKLSKSPDGTYERAQEGRTHVGSVYREKFDQIIQQREVSLYDADHQATLNDLQVQHRLDPQGFLAAANEFGQGQLEKINPDVRAQVEVNYTRELVQRMNQIRSDTTRATVHGAIDAAQTTIAMLDDQNERLSTQVPGPDTVKIIEENANKIAQQLKVLEGTGEINAEGVQARLAQTALRANIAISRAQGFTQVAKVSTLITPQTTDAELTLMHDIFLGGGKADNTQVLGMTGAQWKAAIPVAQWDNADRFIREEQSRRAQALTLQMAAASLQAQQQTVEEQRAENEALNKDPEGGMTLAEQTAREHQLYEHGPLSQQMVEVQVDPKTGEKKMVGQQRILAYTQTFGTPPQQLKGWVDANVNGQLLPQIAQFMMPMQLARSAQGTHIGLNFYNKLDSTTQASLQAYYSLKRIGVDDQTIINQVTKATAQQAVEVKDLAGMFRTEKETYEEVKNAAVAATFGLKTPQDAAALTTLNKDFDNQLAFYKSVGMNNDLALQTAVNAMGIFYSKHEIFLRGVGPTEAMPAGITPADYDQALLKAIPASIRGSATFSNKRLKIDPIEYNPDGGFLGLWNVYVVNSDGQVHSPVQIDMGKRMPEVIKRKMVAAKLEEQRKVEEAIKVHGRKVQREATQPFMVLPGMGQ